MSSLLTSDDLFLFNQGTHYRLYQKLGASKLLWGSDMPNVERSCTYRQTLTYLTRHCDFIPAADLDLIVGGNASALYFS